MIVGTGEDGQPDKDIKESELGSWRQVLLAHWYENRGWKLVGPGGGAKSATPWTRW